MDITEPICQTIDSFKADMTVFDSSGIEAFVTENNPKYANRIIRQLKAYAKSIGFDKNYNPYSAAYNTMPSHASANPEIILDKKSDSPDEDKCAHDSKLLILILKDFFKMHPLIDPKTFLGDAAFDALPLYRDLLTGDTFGKEQHFLSAYIPINKCSSLVDSESFINENGIPCCPNDPSLLLKKEGNNTAFLKNGITRQKFICLLTT